ncbi:MAG: hypothetical protein JWN40_1736 [Phycisphaerales bacterium]|nr:hypothetical protein [Phycisphaerales bacterium]
MGWEQRLAEPADEVHGLIIAYQGDAALHYAVSGVPNLSFQIYEVEFGSKPRYLQLPNQPRRNRICHAAGKFPTRDI